MRQEGSQAAKEQLAERVEEVVADKGYHSNDVLTKLEEVDVRSYIPEPAGRRARAQVEGQPGAGAASERVDHRDGGTQARPRYSLIGRSDPNEATRGPTSKAARNTKTKVNGRSVAGRERNDAAVLAAWRTSPEAGTSSTDLLAATGGTLPQLRLALGRLVAAGKVHREGERDQTRYMLSSSN